MPRRGTVTVNGDPSRRPDAGGDGEARRERQPEEEPEGRLDYHNPLAGVAGAAPARSALTLRLVLAIFGLLVCTGGAVVFALVGIPTGFVVALAVLAAAAAVDIVVVSRRKRRGEPG